MTSRSVLVGAAAASLWCIYALWRDEASASSRRPRHSSSFQERSAMAASVGVKPPSRLNVPPRLRRFMSSSFRWTIRLCHAWDDALPNSYLCLQCLWWKALAANDCDSPAWDDGLTYDLLPAYTRIIVARPFVPLYPRLLHANVEIRTAFLDRAMQRIVDEMQTTNTNTTCDDKKKRQLVSFGAGYDVRSIKMMQRGLVQEAHELDLAAVVQAKQTLLQKRFRKRRPYLALPQLHSVNLNQIQAVEQVLQNDVLKSSDDMTTTIFLFEAVFLYLDAGVASAMVQLCGRLAKENDWLVFVDRLEGLVVEPAKEDEIRQVLRKNGWELVEFLPKVGATRHMVRAKRCCAKNTRMA